jgi:hypothetical protein
VAEHPPFDTGLIGLAFTVSTPQINVYENPAQSATLPASVLEGTKNKQLGSKKDKKNPFLTRPMSKIVAELRSDATDCP